MSTPRNNRILMPPPPAAPTPDQRRAEMGANASWLRPWRSTSPTIIGGFWVLVSCACFSVMGSLVKLLSDDLNSFQVVFFRCAAGFLIMVPLALYTGGFRALRTEAMPMHVARALAGFAAMSCGFYALSHLPLATVTAITFTKPLFLVLIAALFLGETVRWRRWSATLVGFIGVLIILRPGTAELDPAMVVALGQALFIATALALIRGMPKSETNLTVLLYFAVLSTALSVGPAIMVWQTPSLQELGIAVAMGVIGVGAQAALVQGYRIGEASALAPLDYSRLLFATLLGLVIFAEIPDLWTFVGAGVVVASTVYITHREAKLDLPAKPPPADD